MRLHIALLPGFLIVAWPTHIHGQFLYPRISSEGKWVDYDLTGAVAGAR